MISLSDLVALAKAGYGPKQVKELIEVFQTDPSVKDAKVEKTDDGTPEIKKEPEAKSPEAQEPDKKQGEDDIATLINLIKED